MDYFDGPSQCEEDYFRFYQGSIWYTAMFEEINTLYYHVTLYNEQTGTFSRHYHLVQSLVCPRV